MLLPTIVGSASRRSNIEHTVTDETFKQGRRTSRWNLYDRELLRFTDLKNGIGIKVFINFYE